jgi:hypothetical protein
MSRSKRQRDDDNNNSAGPISFYNGQSNFRNDYS